MTTTVKITHELHGGPEPRPETVDIAYLDRMAGGQRIKVATLKEGESTTLHVYGTQTIELTERGGPGEVASD